MRRTSLVVALIGILAAGCGFEPLYGERHGQTSVPEQLTRVRIGDIYAPLPEISPGYADFPIENARSKQILRNYLLDELSLKGAQRSEYVLDLRLVEPRTNLAIDRSDVTVRYGYSVVVYFSLRENGGRTLFSSGASSSTTFEASSSEFATISSQRDARDRAMQEVTADIRNQLAAFFYSQSARPP